jgi:hypothetical protein
MENGINHCDIKVTAFSSSRTMEQRVTYRSKRMDSGV